MSVDKFPPFARLVAASFQDRVKRQNVFVVNIDVDELYLRYLYAFPEGTNPMFKKNTEHECSCCKNFIRHAGNVVTVENGVICTVWDKAAEGAPSHYQEVAKVVRDVVRAAPISDLYRVSLKEISFGAEKTRSLDPATQRALTWDHLYTGEIPKHILVASPGEVKGAYRTTVQVFERGLVELSLDAVDTVISLVDSNSLYRGEEHKTALIEFRRTQLAFHALKEDREKSLFVWTNANSPAARFRNTVIGTLVQDLSEGKDVERAVASFESKVAPENYKRTTSVITPGMVKKAMETIESLGLEPALERRFAVIGDISVNDVKWIDGAVRSLTKGGIGDALLQHAVAIGRSPSREDITLDDFMTRVLPECSSVEILFKNEHAGNLMSLTAPVHPEPKQLFRWTNDFAWSYCGNVADSIKERVKKAGGKVDGAVLRVSLSWFNYDDLDLHIHEPTDRRVAAVQAHIYYANRWGWTGGHLDVDMNCGSGTTREPVENVVWSAKPLDGAYRVVVNNYCFRESRNPGFVVEVESNGRLHHFSYNKPVRGRQDVAVATLHVKTGIVERIDGSDPAITAANISQEKWGLTTEKYVKVNAVMLSPNYWGDNKVGNRHTFFVIDGAKNDEPTRGFYNEFLHPRLEPHRKVFEIIGDKTKCQPTEGQLSGLGFSSTKKTTFILRVHQGKRQRIFNVQVGA